MTFGDYRASPRRRMPPRVRLLSIAALFAGALLIAAASLSSRQAAANDDARTPEMQQQQQVRMQDAMIMKQNAAVWIPQGLVVLQGNRLLHYSSSMKLRHTVTLPIAAPPVHKTTSRDYASVGTQPDEVSSIRSQLAAQLVPAVDGLILVRGLQLIWLDKDFHVVGQALLPELPPLSAEELAAIYPPLPGEAIQMAGPGVPKTAHAGAKSANSPLQKH